MKGPWKDLGKGPRINIEINKQITGDGVRALCTLIETRVGEFNHVNVSTAFRKLLPLQDRRDGASRARLHPFGTPTRDGAWIMG